MVEVGLTVLVVILISAACSLFEAVLYSVPAGHVETLVAHGRRAGRQLQRLRADVQRPIAAILSLNTIANTGGAAFAGAIAAQVLGEGWLPYFSAGLTVAILFLAEIIPKTTGVVYSRRLSTLVAWPLTLLVTILRPLTWTTAIVTNVILRGRKEDTISGQELIVLARLGLKTGSISAHEAEVIQNVLSLEKSSVGHLMTPRDLIYALPTTTTLSELRGNLEDVRHRRIPVYHENLDDIVGFVYRRDLLRAMAQDRWNDTVESIMLPVQFISQTLAADLLLPSFMHLHQHLFVVIDERGRVAGLITLDGVIEEITGKEIVEEFHEAVDLRQLARQRRQAAVEEARLAGRIAESGRRDGH